jgi:predicted secreted protein
MFAGREGVSMRRIWVLAVLMLSVLPCCISRAQSPAGTVVTATDSGRVVNLKPGDTFEVKLEANPSTGYGWTVSPEKNSIVRQKSMKFIRGGAGDVPGAGGTNVWKFEGVKAGNQKLTFNYQRPWEKGVPAVKTVWFSVVVQQP